MKKRLLKGSLIFLSLIVIMTIPFTGNAQCLAPLSGTYTVNASQAAGSNNYQNFSDLAADLNGCGVSGHVTVNVASGIYNEHIYLDNVSGTSDTSTIIIQADPSNTSPAELSYKASSSSDNYVIKLDRVSHLTIRGLSISAQDSTYGYGIYVGSNPYFGNQHITIEKNYITGLPSFSGEASCLYGAAENTNITIKDNVINGGSAGINLENRVYSRAMIVDSNQVSGWTLYGINIRSSDNSVISNNMVTADSLNFASRPFEISGSHNSEIVFNTIDVSSAGPVQYAMRVTSGQRSNIIGNRINAVADYGLYTTNTKGSISDKALIANNMIVLDSGNGGGEGMRIHSTDHIDFIHNLIIVNGSKFGYGLNLQGYFEGVAIYNNSIVNNTGGPALNFSSLTVAADVDSLDHNNYYSTGNTLIHSGGVDYSDIRGWQNAVGWEEHSINKDPDYVPGTNLSAWLDGAGTPFPSVTHDIDGDLRSIVSPDIGAYEFVLEAGDCSLFTDFGMDSITDNAVRIDWVPGDGNNTFYLEYGPKGYTYGGMDTTGSVSGSYPSGIPPIVIYGLTADTEYDFYLTEYCGSGDSSYSLVPRPVRTTVPCLPVAYPEMIYLSADSVAFSFEVPGPYSSEFQFEYGPAGYDQGTGTTRYVGNPGGLGGLSPATTYDLYIRANCSDSSRGVSDVYGPVTFTTNCTTPLSGTYTLNSTLPSDAVNMRSFNELENRLNLCGVSGPVTVNVAQGEYKEQIYLHNIDGTSSNNTVLIQADPSNTGPVRITNLNQSGENSYVVKLDTVSHLTIKNLTIVAEGGQYGYAIDMSGGANSHITFENDSILCKAYASSSSVVPVYLNPGISGSSDHLIFKDNVIKGGYYNLYIVGRSVDVSTGLVIEGNEISESYYKSMHIYYYDSTRINNNTVTVIDGSPHRASGIELSYCEYSEVYHNNIYTRTGNYTFRPVYINRSNGTNVVGNKLNAASGLDNYGIQYSYSNGSDTSRALIANNMVVVYGSTSADGRRSAFGFSFFSSSNFDFLHNSVNIIGSNSNTSYGVYLDRSGNNSRFLNNNIANSAGGYSIGLLYASLDSNSMDYNNYYSAGDVLAKNNQNDISNIIDWQSSTGYDAHSLSGEPFFVAPDDLHALGPFTNNNGIPIDPVSIDIDGDPRSAVTPDIGADEHVLGCYYPLNPSLLQAYSDSLFINWVPGASALTHIEYGPEGFTPGTGAGTFITGINDTFYTITGLSPQTFYDVYLRTDCGSGEISPWGKSLTAMTACEQPLSGQYTIDPSQPAGPLNFHSFSAVATDLNQCGISGPVVVKVAPGYYIDSLHLGEIEGSSAVSTVVFDGGATSEVYVTDSAVGGMPIVYLNGTDHITFKNLTLSNANDSYVILLQNSADHNTIDSCRIEMSVSSSRGVIGVGTSNNLTRIVSGNNAHFLTVSNSTFIGGEIGINLRGGYYSEEINQRHIIKNNIFRKQLDHGIEADGVNDILISGNDIDSLMSSGGDALYLSNIDDYDISGNRIISPDYALYISGGNDADSLSGRSKIVNNMVLSESDYGVYLRSSKTDVYYNSIVGSPAIRLIVDDVDIRNNIFYSPSDYALVSGGFDSSDVVDYNIYYSGDTVLFNNYKDLAAWQTADPIKNIHSIETDPLFLSLSNNDLHIGSGSPAIGAGVPLSVEYDFEGNARSVTAPDIGAHEYTPYAKDMSLVDIYAPADSSCGDSNSVISVIIQNLGTEKAYNFTVVAEVDGTTPTILYHLYLDTLGSEEMDTIYLSSFNSISGGAFAIEVSIQFSGDSVSVNNVSSDTLYLYNVESPVLLYSKGYFCESGVFDTLYTVSDQEILWLSSDSIIIGTTDSLVVGPLEDQDTTFYLGVNNNICNIPLQSVTLDHVEETMASFNYTAGQPTTTDLTVSFDASGSNGATVHSWGFGDGHTGSGKSVTHTYTANGFYTVTLVVDGDCGTDTISQTIEIIGISIEENVISRSLQIYPNPISRERNTIHVSFKTQSSEDANIYLTDLSGKLVMQKRLTDLNGRYDGEISLGRLAKGTYMLRIESGELQAVERIVRQ